MTTWLTIIGLAAVFLWSVWTLAVGLGKGIRKLTSDDYPQELEIPWIERVSPSAVGPVCPSCGENTIVTKHDERLTGLLCSACSTYGLVYPEFIEWQIPGEGVRIATLDPTAPTE